MEYKSASLSYVPSVRKVEGGKYAELFHCFLYSGEPPSPGILEAIGEAPSDYITVDVLDKLFEYEEADPVHVGCTLTALVMRGEATATLVMQHQKLPGFIEHWGSEDLLYSMARSKEGKKLLIAMQLYKRRSSPAILSRLVKDASFDDPDCVDAIDLSEPFGALLFKSIALYHQEFFSDSYPFVEALYTLLQSQNDVIRITGLKLLGKLKEVFPDEICAMLEEGLISPSTNRETQLTIALFTDYPPSYTARIAGRKLYSICFDVLETGAYENKEAALLLLYQLQPYLSFNQADIQLIDEIDAPIARELSMCILNQ